MTRLLKRNQFGTKSEKLDDDQLNLGLEDLETAIASGEAEQEMADAKLASCVTQVSDMSRRTARKVIEGRTLYRSARINGLQTPPGDVSGSAILCGDDQMGLPFHTLDVFTDVRFCGNPLAVVLEADGLDVPLMQKIAREFGFSETVFVSKPQNPAHSARLRIFTPNAEVPFAGHPTVGTAILLSTLKQQNVGGEGEALVLLEQPLGTVRVGVRLRGGTLGSYAEFDAPKTPELAAMPPASERIAAAIGLLPGEIGFENHLPVRASAGNGFALIPVRSLDAMSKVAVNPSYWNSTLADSGIIGAFLYTRECLHTTSAFHARMFAPAVGVAEDPATGSAAICFAGAVHRFDKLPDGIHRRIIEQGFEMGRPSFMTLTLVVSCLLYTSDAADE